MFNFKFLFMWKEFDVKMNINICTMKSWYWFTIQMRMEWVSIHFIEIVNFVFCLILFNSNLILRFTFILNSSWAHSSRIKRNFSWNSSIECFNLSKWIRWKVFFLSVNFYIWFFLPFGFEYYIVLQYITIYYIAIYFFISVFCFPWKSIFIIFITFSFYFSTS